MNIADPIRLGGFDAPNRLVFGPHETNLARDRSISDRHVAYYARRATGGAGIIVTEEASVHDSDWPYERAPLAADSAPGWHDVAAAVHAGGAGTLVVAALGHSGGQGSSAYSQEPLLAPSRVPEVNTREVPKWMEATDIAAVVDGFALAAGLAARSGMDGVEVNAGQYSLVRQFLSGLTNLRDDEWGTDKLRFARDVLTAARHGLDTGTRTGPRRILGLRLSCDELAPWAGLTPESAAQVAVALAPMVDYLVVVRGSIFTAAATRPDFHEPAGFNRELCALIRTALRDADIDTPVVLQGSVVDPDMADSALDDGTCDLVEMTRAQIADPALGAKVAGGRRAEVRPSIRSNQMTMVRDARNPIVTCEGEPSSGHETDDPSPLPDGPIDPIGEADRTGRGVLVVGGGPAGLEAARVAAALGHPVRLVEATDRLGARMRFPVPGSGNPDAHLLADWLEAEARRLGAVITTGEHIGADDVVAALGAGEAVIVATGSANGTPGYTVAKGGAARIVSAADLCAHWASGASAGEPRFRDEPPPEEIEPGGETSDVASTDASGGTLRAVEADETIVVLDPIGGPIGVAVAEALSRRPGARIHLVTQDHLAGNELARSGDLAPANARLQQAGVVIERRSIPRRVAKPTRSGRSRVTIEDRFTGATRTIDADRIVDAGFRLPDTTLIEAVAEALDAPVEDADVHVIGDAVAPRTVHEAILEARRAVVQIHEGRRA